MGGTPVIENPGSSMIWLHDRFQWLLGILENAGIRDPQPNIERYTWHFQMFFTMCLASVWFQSCLRLVEPFW